MRALIRLISDISTDSTFGEVLIVLSALMVAETIVIFILALHRHATSLTQPLMQRACIRIMLIGPVYSGLVIIALWKPLVDSYASIPIGIYEGYAMLSFFETIVIYLGGEQKAALALVAQTGKPIRSRMYFGLDMIFGQLCYSCNKKSDRRPELGWYMNTFHFDTGRSLYSHLKNSVAQYSIMKPLSSIAIIVLQACYPDNSNKFHIVRVVDVIVLLVALQPLLQLYSAALPRLRGLGGDKIFMLLSLVVVVIFIQELITALVCVLYVLEWRLNESYTQTIQISSVKWITFFTIIEYTLFSNIFYRFFIPGIFEGTAATLWAGSEEKILMSSTKFVQEVFSFWNIFDGGANYATVPRNQSWKELASGGAAAEDDENGPAEEPSEETTKLL